MTGGQRFVGLDLAPLPYESLRSAASRFTWRNGVARGELKQHYDQIRNEERDSDEHVDLPDNFALEALTGWSSGGKAENDFYQRCARSESGEFAYTLRFCPICLEECYHSYLFQWFALQCCPIHDCRLEMHCIGCGRPVKEPVHRSEIGRLGYRCSRCNRPIAGAEPSLELHLALRAQAALIENRLGHWREHFKLVYHPSHPIVATRAFLAMQSKGSAAQWGNKRAIVQALQTIICEEGPSDSIAIVQGITFIRWRLNVGEYRYWPASSTWRERTRSLGPVYLATCKAIENWLFPGEMGPGEIERVCLKFDLSRDASPIDDWNPLELAYVLLRFTQEGQGLSYRHRSNQCFFLHLRDAPLALPRWNSGGRMPRLAYRAWLLAAFSTLHSLVMRHIGTPIDQIIQIPQFPAPIVPAYVDHQSDPRFLAGGVFFPTLEGLPLKPFDRRKSAYKGQ